MPTPPPEPRVKAPTPVRPPRDSSRTSPWLLALLIVVGIGAVALAVAAYILK
ncbi:hypothetical protein [Agromyces atrinae]|uniref:Uncharacterized protein n=1 Tax=Agromyces atrinae TaxID=592376 RepID=A0A852S5B5_9MICO|nr:hypothetical protein [Agromyces atrinae]NYD68498.1 hypothetical protein [Agromyces atrinae]